MTSPFLGPVVETGPWTRRVVLVLFIIAVIYLGFQAVISIFLALDNATSFSGYALDGAFQLYNPLRRMEQGEVPGRDFPFFHGVGMPWLHFPLYMLLGSNIFASEMARWLLSPLLFSLSGLVFFRAVLGTWTRATIALAAFVAMSIVPAMNLVDPGNSMAGIRSMTPLLIAAAMIWPVRRRRVALGFVEWHTSLLVAYVLLGVGVALGTEQGVAAIGAFLLIRFFLNARRLRWGWRLIAQTGIDVVASLASVFVLLSLLTAGNAVAALRYALIDIPADQGWVFGSLPNPVVTPDALLWELRAGPVFDIFGMVPGFLITALTAVALLILARRVRAVAAEMVPWSIFLWIYGLAVLTALLGYINLPAQLGPFGRVSTAVVCALGVAIAITLIARAEARLTRPAAGGRGRAALWLGGAVTLVALGALFLGTSVAPRAALMADVPKRAVLSDAVRAPFQTDYEVAGDGYKQAIDGFAPYIPEDATVWATYTSLYSSALGVFTPAPGGEDYIIHALGKDRREAYEQAFIDEAPDVVITTNPNYTIYEEWLWGRYPTFFRTLITDYTLTAVNGSHILWLRNAEEGAAGDSVEVSPGADGSFELPGNDTERVKYYELTVDYRASGGTIPVLNRLPRFYLQFEGAALGLYGEVLPDNETTWSIVVPVFPGTPHVRVTTAIGGVATFASLDIEDASFRELTVPIENDELIKENFCSWDRTDERCE